MEEVSLHCFLGIALEESIYELKLPMDVKYSIIEIFVKCFEKQLRKYNQKFICFSFGKAYCLWGNQEQIDQQGTMGCNYLILKPIFSNQNLYPILSNHNVAHISIFSIHEKKQLKKKIIIKKKIDKNYMI